MASSKEKRAGRLVTVSPHLYEPCDYGRWLGVWYGLTPNGMLANLGNHEVEFHEDTQTISVKPSILVRGSMRDGEGEDGSWHGYLKEGTWEEC